MDGIKFKLRKSNKSSKESPPTVPASGGREAPAIKVVPTPNNARHEATLSSNSDQDLNAVAPGNDPLTQDTGTIHHALSSADFSSNEAYDKQLTNGPSEGGVALGSKFGQCLKIEDHQRLAEFVEVLVGKRLLPHLTEVLKNLNEWVSPCNYTMHYWTLFIDFGIFLNLFFWLWPSIICNAFMKLASVSILLSRKNIKARKFIHYNYFA